MLLLIYLLDYNIRLFYSYFSSLNHKLNNLDLQFLAKIFNFIICLEVLILVLISVAFFTLLERKKLGSIQSRLGPNKVGLLGVLQPISDALKLITKEIIIPRVSISFIFVLSPILAFIFGLLSWGVFPFSYDSIISNTNFSLLVVFIISVFHVYGIILAGWSSNSRYSFLGAMRSSAQLVSYDISFGLVLLTIFLHTKSLNLIKILEFQDFNGWLVLYFPIPFIIFFICSLAETNRHPFDLPEAEAELVSGYNVEYSAISFALFFLGEYGSILFVSSFIVLFFLGGPLPFLNLNYIDLVILFNWNFAFFFIHAYICKITFFWFFIKLILVIYMFIISRAIIPRYRYDQLMRIGWKFILPLSLAIFILNFCILEIFYGNYNFLSNKTKFFFI